MKITSAIQILAGLKKEYGDLDIAVVIPDCESDEDITLTDAMITIERDENDKVVGLIFLDSRTRDDLHDYADDDKLDDHE